MYARGNKRRVDNLLKLQWHSSLTEVRSNHAKYTASFHDHIRAGDHRGAVAALSRLGQEALLQRGAYCVLRAQPGGWVDIERAALYRALSIAVNRVLSVFSGGILAHVMLAGRNKLADAASRIVEQDMVQDADCWEKRYFARFVMHLRHRASGQDVRPDFMATGPFQPVIDAWADPAALQRALSDVCAYHLEPSGPMHSAGEFHVYYELIPIEIAFIRVIRANEGLETPAIDHPLLRTPFARIPEGPQYDLTNDDLWLRARDLLKQKMSELDLDP
jgi:hypothetical protein